MLATSDLPLCSEMVTVISHTQTEKLVGYVPEATSTSLELSSCTTSSSWYGIPNLVHE